MRYIEHRSKKADKTKKYEITWSDRNQPEVLWEVLW